MDAEDWLKGIEKKLMIAQCMDRDKVLFAAHQLFGMVENCGRHTAILMQTSIQLRAMSFKLVSVPTLCPIAL
jgi:hypothetical protein